VDNNIFSNSDTWDDSEGTMFVHNLFVNQAWNGLPTDSRSADYFKPHTTTTAGTATHASAGNRYFNNIHVDKGTDSIAQATGYQMDYNVFYGAANKSSWGDAHSIVKANVTAGVQLTTLPNGVTVSLTADSAPRDVAAPLITRALLGLVTLTQEGIENHDGSPITIDHDLTGAARDMTHPTVGPFEKLAAGVNTFTITAGAGTPPNAGGSGGTSSGSAGSAGTPSGTGGSTSTVGTSGGGANAGSTTAGSGTDLGAGSGANASADKAGCGCHLSSARRGASSDLFALVLACGASLWRRRSASQRVPCDANGRTVKTAR
jgi:hypothetical protein